MMPQAAIRSTRRTTQQQHISDTSSYAIAARTADFSAP
jgi:hypothetical protein